MSSSKDNEPDYKRNQALIDEQAKAKHKRRIELANLPFEEKIKIIVKLQEIDSALAIAAGRKPKKVWEI